MLRIYGECLVLIKCALTKKLPTITFLLISVEKNPKRSSRMKGKRENLKLTILIGGQGHFQNLKWGCLPTLKIKLENLKLKVLRK